MPSNQDLKDSIAKAAEGLDREINTDGLNNNELAKLLAEVKAEAEADGNESDTAPEAPEAEVAEKPEYYMAPRKSITSKKGILSGDDEDEVRASFLEGGQKALDAFVRSGHVLKG